MYVFVDKRCLFKPLSFKLCCPLKPVSLWVNLVCSLFFFPIHCVSYYFLWKWGISKPAFWIFGGEIQNRGKTIFNVGDQNMMKLWYRSKEILINKVFFFSIWVFFHEHSTEQRWKWEIILFTYFSLPLPPRHIKKIFIKPGKLSIPLLILRNCGPKYSIIRWQRYHKKPSRSRKRWSY